MNIRFSQIYIEQGAEFPFSHMCMKYLDDEVSHLVHLSSTFMTMYGADYELIFRISAKHSLEQNEIRGPTVFKKAKDVEYTIFLPYEVIVSRVDAPRVALIFLFQGIYTVLNWLGIDSDNLLEREAFLIKRICSDPAMFRVRHNTDSDVGPPVWTAIPPVDGTDYPYQANR